MDDNNKTELDILHEVEKLTKRVNSYMEMQSHFVFRRYPLTFTLLALFGVVAVSEGLKGVIEDLGFTGHPWYMLFAGLVILIITGTLYKKLDK
jgi:H+/gluconate symporter-like permease